MIGKRTRWAWVGIFGLALTTGAAWAQDVVPVTAKGEGISEDAALKDALRNAIEQGGQVEISSHSQVENFELIRDTIYARADGIVTDYKIRSNREGAGGIFYCVIDAKVSKKVIASTWGEVQNVLDQIGRPKIAVYILERIDNVVQDSSILESKIEERLIESGFDVYDRSHLEDIARRESADAVAESNVAKAKALAKKYGAQIFITGTAQANAAGVQNLYGRAVAMYNGDAMAKMYYTDTGKLISSKSIPNWRGGAQSFHTLSPQAGKMALENAGVDLVEAMYWSAMKYWATQITAGGEIQLEVEGMNMVGAIKLKKKLRTIPKVETINGPSLDKGIATFRIVAKMNAEQMVEYLVEPEFESIMEVVDLKLNRIQAKAK